MGRPVLKVGNCHPEDIKAMFRDDERYTIGVFDSMLCIKYV
jgi:hypothetical protein